MRNNPIIFADFPDPDVIRVEDTYYMVSTTMHFMPGAVILRSYDLLQWEIISYVYDELEDTKHQHLEGEFCIYGQGMWAASLRYHNNTFYVCFVANDTHKTYLYQAKDIKGPFKKQYIEGFYHDCSLLFDEDRVFIAYGNKEIHLTELTPDLTGKKVGGLDRVIVKDKGNVTLGYEGSHLYKINGKYYIFFIHWLRDGSKRRVEACFVSDSLEGEFVGGDILDDDMGYYNQGIAQGGIVDTKDGKWYAVLFQDYGAVGRIPVLVPMHFENDFPVFGIDGKVPNYLEVKSTHPEHVYEPLFGSDDFYYAKEEAISLKSFWQWNHIPSNDFWSVTEKAGCLRIYSNKICKNVTYAVNTLTQRMMYPSCEANVHIDGSALKEGDYAGICALQGCYGFIALTKENGRYYLVMIARQTESTSLKGKENESGKEFARIPIENEIVTLKVRGNFENMVNEAEFFYKEKEEWKKLGITHKLYFKLDHFVGCRVALFLYSTKEIGGMAEFSNFEYQYNI